MTTKYYCDICEKETNNHKNIELSYGSGGNADFDICDECLSTKSLKQIVSIIFSSDRGTFQKLTLLYYNFVKKD